MKLIKSFLFDNFPIDIKIGNIRPKYIHKTSVIPKKYQNELFYDFDNDGYLIEILTGIKVITNKNKVDKGNIITINGSHLYEGSYSKQGALIKMNECGKIKNVLSAYFRENITKINNLFSTLTIEFIFEFDKNTGVNDLDNLDLFYRKSFLDAFQTTYIIAKGKEKKIINNPNGSIKNDDKNTISCLISKFNHSDNERKLTINIYENV